MAVRGREGGGECGRAPKIGGHAREGAAEAAASRRRGHWDARALCRLWPCRHVVRITAAHDLIWRAEGMKRVQCNTTNGGAGAELGAKTRARPLHLLPAAPYLALSSRASRALPWAVSKNSKEV